MSKSVFISSTFKDLATYQDAVVNRLHQTNNLPIAMGTFGSKSGNATTVSLEEVRKADVFVGIYAKRYGYRPDDDKSITEMEYMEAVKLKIPRFIFIVDDDFDDPTSPINLHAETDDEGIMLLEIFKRRLNRDNVRDIFTTPEDLAQKVQNALMNWLQDELARMEKESKDQPKPSGGNQVNFKQNVKDNQGSTTLTNYVAGGDLNINDN